jgi:NAD(P)-dependent dehydrogenase (short-subunit alcohol dehydrogenase family)
VYEVPDQHGVLAVVTGANGTLGAETTRRLAAAGASVVLAVRDVARGEQLRAQLLTEHPGADLTVRRLDLADLTSVRAFSQELLDTHSSVDLLVNNAGILAPPSRMTTRDGFELQFGTNVLGPLALTVQLLPGLLTSPAARVVWLGALVSLYGRLVLWDLDSTHRYDPDRVYADTKLADTALARHLAAEATRRGWALTSLAAHPGFVPSGLHTSGPSLGRDRPTLSLFARTGTRIMPANPVPQAVEPVLHAATSPAAENGGYYGPRRLFGLLGPTGPARLPRGAQDDVRNAALWAEAERRTGVVMPSAR